MMSEEDTLDRKCDVDNIHMDKDQQALQITHKRKRDEDVDDDDHKENQDSSSQYPPWANGLPIEMIEKILEKLPLSSYAYFLAVCRPWKQIAMKHYLQPYLCNLPCYRWLCDPWMINVSNFKRMYITHPFFNERYCVGSYQGWFLIKMKKSCKVCVMNLFNGERFKLPEWTPRLFGGSIFLSSSPISDNCTALVIGRYVSDFAYCKIGDSKWSIDKHLFIPRTSDGVKEYLDQAVTLDEKFYVLTSFGRLLCIDDVHNPRLVSIVGHNKVVPKREVFRYYPYLMESEGEILLVFVCIPGRVRALDHVEVFRFDFESAAWVRLEKLHGRTLYVGFNCSFTLRTVKDYVCFVDNASDGWRVFDMEKKEIVEIMYFDSCGPSDVRDRVWILPTLERPAAASM